MENNPYTENGYKDREDYLNQLAEQYGKDAVYTLATLLGRNEDFDGLVTMLEDTETEI